MTLALLGLLSVLFAFVSAELSLSSGLPTAPWAASLLKHALPLLGFDFDMLSADTAEYKNVVSIFLSSGLRAVTIWFALVPVLAYFSHRRKIQREGPIDVHRVWKVGRSDLRTMLQYYRLGEKVTIFSGDFDWVLKNKKLRKLLEERAQKIRLVSYKTEEDIERAWKQTGKLSKVPEDEVEKVLGALRPCFRFHDKEFKFSFIDIGSGQTAFLSLVPPASLDGRHQNIGAHSAKNHLAASILHVVRNLFKLEDYDELRRWGSTSSEPEAGSDKESETDAGVGT